MVSYTKCLTALAGVMMLANAPVEAADTRPIQFSDLSATTIKTQDHATSEKSDVEAGTLLADSVASQLIGSADPSVSIAPVETIKIVPSSQQVAVSTETETDKPLQEENEIIVTARTRTPIDPLQNVNVVSYAITQAVDEAVVEPSAHAYEKAVPEPVRNGLRNFANNLHEPVVFVNFLLQLKPGHAAETAGRFLVNSTVGVAGLFDFAKRKPFNLPRRRNGFADTLGCYGVKPGPFLFLPLIGPTTIRDLIGGSIDGFAIPLPLPGTVARPLSQPPIAISRSIARELDKRIDFDDDLQKIRNSSDPYVATREHYLQRRQSQIDENCGKKNINVKTSVEQTTTSAALLTSP